jgi:hypothetical protein
MNNANSFNLKRSSMSIQSDGRDGTVVLITEVGETIKLDSVDFVPMSGYVAYEQGVFDTCIEDMTVRELEDSSTAVVTGLLLGYEQSGEYTHVVKPIKYNSMSLSAMAELEKAVTGQSQPFSVNVKGGRENMRSTKYSVYYVPTMTANILDETQLEQVSTYLANLD